MLLALVLLPLVLGLVAFGIRSKLGRSMALVAGAVGHAALVAVIFVERSSPTALAGYLALDDLGRLFLAVVSLLFLACAVYTVKYRRVAPPRTSRVYVPLNLLLLAMMTVQASAQHLGILWVASGLTTLGAAPLIYLHKGGHALEATWKYILICSVGIAIALLGIFCMAIAETRPGAEAQGLFLSDVVTMARDGQLSLPWLRMGFLCLLVGFGTKMGLAPMHTWKPDTYAEAPTPVGALMATAICNCAFLCVLRGWQICAEAGEQAFAARLMLALGVVSIATGAVFVVGQADMKRLLAYSGIEHMGICAIGVGIGGIAAYGAMLHMVAHSLCKGLLFFAAGNVELNYKTRTVAHVTGLLRSMPVSGALVLLGFFATLGFPPFAMFSSELTIVRGAIDGGAEVVAAVLLAGLGAVFMAVIAIVCGMAYGADPRGAEAAPLRESRLLTWPAIALLGLALWVGIAMPAPLDRALVDAAVALRGAAPVLGAAAPPAHAEGGG
jgi:hydrogenase-4 component F